MTLMEFFIALALVCNFLAWLMALATLFKVGDLLDRFIAGQRILNDNLADAVEPAPVLARRHEPGRN